MFLVKVSTFGNYKNMTLASYFESAFDIWDFLMDIIWKNGESGFDGVVKMLGKSGDFEGLSVVHMDFVGMKLCGNYGKKDTFYPNTNIDINEYLDYKIAGLQPSDLILVAARPSMGKTAFVLNVAEKAANFAKVQDG